jgi:AAA+ ATPase superfamily predicted ATPase
MDEPENPFLIQGYEGPAYFCDREDETARLMKILGNGSNVTLFSYRRLGKTGLISHFFQEYEKDHGRAAIYVDIQGTKDLPEFVNKLATAIYRKFPEKKPAGRVVMDFISLLRPVISYDELSGQPQVSLQTGRAFKPERTIEQLFGFLEKQNKKIVVAIDEFQQILSYPERNTEALLRSHVQPLRRTHFIFSGSDQKIMHELFSNAKRPFFASCHQMNLSWIEPGRYKRFIKRMFARRKRKIDAESLDFIIDWTLNHTYYTQFLCNCLFASGETDIRLDSVKTCALEVIRAQEPVYFQYRNLLTSAQWETLSAVAAETRLYKPHSKDFIQGYRLGTSSLVARTLAALLEKEMVFYNAAAEKPYYEVYDKFLMRWLQRNRAEHLS